MSTETSDQDHVSELDIYKYTYTVNMLFNIKQMVFLDGAVCFLLLPLTHTHTHNKELTKQAALLFII